MKAGRMIPIGLALALLFSAGLAADTLSLKQRAKHAYELKKYPAAQALARQATEANPNDAEAWFLLGWYTHYRCYDTRPLSGYSRATSDSILTFFERAAQLDPKLGDAYYFIGAEYGCRCRDALCRGDAKQARAELRAARARNAYPDWALEYCRNVLTTCDQDAILFVDGDILVNGISYVQLMEGYRTDVSAVYCWNRPRLALLFKDGIPGAVTPTPISWTRDQILDRQSFPWNGDTLRILVNPEALANLGIAAHPDSVMKLGVPGPFMNAYTALLIDILETNRWRRPVFAASGVSLLECIDSCFQDCGLASRLLPINAIRSGLRSDTTRIKGILLDPASYRNLATVKDHDMPRASGILFNYRAGLAGLAIGYNESGNSTACNEVLDRMAELVPESVVPMPPEAAQFIQRLRKGGKPQ